MIVLGRSKVDEKGRVVLPKQLRSFSEVVFYEVEINGEKYVVVKGEE